MRKFFKIFISMVVALTLVVSNMSVLAAQTMTITTKSYVATGFGSRKEAKFKTNLGYAFCVTPDKTGAPQGTNLTYKGWLNDGGLLYLMTKTATDDQSYLATQVAIWTYYNKYTPDIYKQNANSALMKKVNNLVADAKNHSNYHTSPALAVSPLSSELTLQNGSFKSAAFAVASANIEGNTTVTLEGAPSGAKIVNKNGSEISTVNNGDVFYIIVPESSVTSNTSFSVTISGKGTERHVEMYSPSNSNYQSLGVLVASPKNLNVKLNLTAKPVVRTCQKYNGKFYGKDGREVDEVTYQQECEKHTCEKVGDKYFGKDGKVVSYETYQIECEKHTCEKVGDKYFGLNGTVVDEATYKNECEPTIVPVPDTANTSFGGLLAIIAGSAILGATFVTLEELSNKKSKKRKARI